jgi:hypothetical protein
MTDKFKTPLAGAVTIIALIGFAILVVYLFDNMDMTEQRWLRSTYLLAGIEAIVFASVGWLFGKEVHRAQAESAEQRADESEEKANKGEALAQMVLAKSQVRQSSNSGYGSLGASEKAAVSSLDLTELTGMAQQIVSVGRAAS